MPPELVTELPAVPDVAPLEPVAEPTVPLLEPVPVAWPPLDEPVLEAALAPEDPPDVPELTLGPRLQPAAMPIASAASAAERSKPRKRMPPPGPMEFESTPEAHWVRNPQGLLQPGSR